ncbi:hypothetical protein RHECNPAF_470069 [Rhizobium etli CNPAF512]|nr:hypothetical protein RHECNPAF_470069 [Rhizobium etli CNPAF512]
MPFAAERCGSAGPSRFTSTSPAGTPTMSCRDRA